MYRRKKLGKLLTAIGAAIMALALLAPAAQAAEPLPGYEQFAGCPSPEENPNVQACIRSEVTGGHFQMGSKTVPITKPIVFSGGFALDGEFSHTSKGGLLPSKQEIPGGIVGLTGLDWLVNFLSLDALKVYAVTELAGEPSFPLQDPFHLPIKVRLVNPALGNNCYVGSNSNPINLNLTMLTTNPPPPNEPISGKFPVTEFDSETGIGTFTDAIFVDNAFSAPGASGCKLTLLGLLPISLDSLVNAQSGLPAPAGTNETVQEADAEGVERWRVYP